MQATQSNNASDFFESDSTGPRNIHSDIPSDIHAVDGRMRDLPSPFTAPIQAARKYLERQRGIASQADALVAGVTRGEERNPAIESMILESTTRQSVTREEITRERDRRLERSLYEGHSIEAALNFEEPHSFAASERAYFDDSDGSEPLYPYAAPGPVSKQTPDHDPDTVRGAIFRLARKSGAIDSGTVYGASAYGASAGRPDSVSVEGPVEARPAHPSAFADVARRVWQAAHDVQDTVAEVNSQVTPPQLSVAERQAAALRSHSVEAQVKDARIGSAFEDAALAHDVCNLLSALGLYSDLLNVPGVLAEEHRHYAQELKLIAGRSRALTDRMLKPAEAATERMTALEAEAKRSAERPREPGISRPAVTHRADSPQSLPGQSSIAGVAQALARREIPAPQQAPIHAGIHVTPRPAAAPAAGSFEPTSSPNQRFPLIGAAHEIAEEVADKVPIATATTRPATNLVDLLTRWGSLLSTLAHGTLDVCFGPQAATPVPIEAEPLERILVNLVRNARAATIAGGAIRIGVSGHEENEKGSVHYGGAIVLTVDDSGCGMTEAQINRILGIASRTGIEPGPEETEIEPTALAPHLPPDPSGRAEDGRRQGLGLQVVKEMVRDSGGTLTIQSSPGRGTRVEICWPVATAPVRAERPVPRIDAASTVVPEPSVQTSPVEVQPSLVPSQPVAVGPDGFSETELRTMMLRLHRQGLQPARFEADIYSAGKGAIAC